MRFSEGSWAQIRREATEQGISASAYIREAVFLRLAWDAVKRDPRIVDEYEAIRRFIRELVEDDPE